MFNYCGSCLDNLVMDHDSVGKQAFANKSVTNACCLNMAGIVRRDKSNGTEDILLHLAGISAESLEQ